MKFHIAVYDTNEHKTINLEGESESISEFLYQIASGKIKHEVQIGVTKKGQPKMRKYPLRDDRTYEIKTLQTPARNYAELTGALIDREANTIHFPRGR